MEKMISYNCEVFFLPSNDIYDEIDDYFSLILEKIKYIASEQWFSQMFWIDSWLRPNPIRTYLFVLNLTNNFLTFMIRFSRVSHQSDFLHDSSWRI